MSEFTNTRTARTSQTTSNKGTGRTKATALAAAGLAGLMITGFAVSSQAGDSDPKSRVAAVSPALAQYDTEQVQALWQDPSLSARDRSLVTVATMVSAGQSADLRTYVERALDDGVTPAELSETITHLAFYTGWPNAMAAVPVVADVYEDRGIDKSQLPETDPELLPLDAEAEAERHRTVQQDVGGVSPGVVDATEELFHDLWLRPELAPRDRSLVTVVALIATAQSDQIPFHLNRAMDNGLTAEEVDGLLEHVIYFTGWPRTMTAVPVIQEVLDGRS